MQYRSPYWLEPAPAPCSTGALIGWSRLLLQLQYRSPYWLEPAPAPAPADRKVILTLLKFKMKICR